VSNEEPADEPVLNEEPLPLLPPEEIAAAVKHSACLFISYQLPNDNTPSLPWTFQQSNTPWSCLSTKYRLWPDHNAWPDFVTQALLDAEQESAQLELGQELMSSLVSKLPTSALGIKLKSQSQSANRDPEPNSCSQAAALAASAYNPTVRRKP
jgi:hypothetical protein